MTTISEDGTVVVTFTPEEFLANVETVYAKLAAAKDALPLYQPSHKGGTETYEQYLQRRNSLYGDMVADALGALASHLSFARGYELTAKVEVVA